MTQPILSLGEQLNAVITTIATDIKTLRTELNEMKNASQHNTQQQGDANLPQMVRNIINQGTNYN